MHILRQNNYENIQARAHNTDNRLRRALQNRGCVTQRLFKIQFISAHTHARTHARHFVYANNRKDIPSRIEHFCAHFPAETRAKSGLVNIFSVVVRRECRMLCVATRSLFPPNREKLPVHVVQLFCCETKPTARQSIQIIVNRGKGHTPKRWSTTT